MWVRRAWPALFFAACGSSEPTSILVRVEASGRAVTSARATLAIGRPTDVCDPQPLATSAGEVALPGRFVALVDDAVDVAYVTVEGRTSGGCRVAGGKRVDVEAGAQTSTTIRLESEEPETCCNGALDPGEQAIDCGGACAPCDLASGPPHWRAGPVLGAPRTKLAAVAARDGRIYAIGGDAGGALDTIESLSPLEDPVWRAEPSHLSVARSRGAAATAGSRVFVAGGSSDKTLASMDLIEDDTVTPAAPMTVAREGFGLAAVGESIYAVGGNDASGPLASVEVYDVARDAWLPRANLPAPTQRIGAVMGPDGALYVFGGRTSQLTASALRYEPETDRWSPIASLASPRLDVVVVSAGDDRIFTIGGQDDARILGEVSAYTPRTKRWSPVAPIVPPRTDASAVAGCDGRVWSIGGTLLDPYDPLVAVYGPDVHAQPSSAAAGSSITLAGENFAANAQVRVWFGTKAGEPAATGATDETGHLLPISLAVPSVSAGSWPITIVDDRSLFPVTTLLVVTR